MCAYDIGQSSILEVVGRKFQTSDDLQGPAYVAHGRRREGERDEVLRTPSSAQKNLGALEAAAKKAAGESREKTQMYVQRYIGRFPAAGEIVIFDRSWYNRAGVENVMGFISPKDVERFLKSVRKSRNTSPTLASFSQILAAGRQAGAGEALSRAHQRPAAAMEARPDGSGIVPAPVRLFAGSRYDAQSHRRRLCAVAYRAVGRQEARPTELHLDAARRHFLQEDIAAEGQAAETLE